MFPLLFYMYFSKRKRIVADVSVISDNAVVHHSITTIEKKRKREKAML